MPVVSLSAPCPEPGSFINFKNPAVASAWVFVIVATGSSALDEVADKPVAVPASTVSQTGTPEESFKNSPLEPLANLVPVPDVPPYIISPSALIGERASKPADLLPAPVPPSAIATSVPPALYTALPSIVISPELALAIVVSEACPSSMVPAVVTDKS